jgi:FkbM family methyltransferase
MSLKDAVKRFLLKRNTVLSKPPGQFQVTEYKLRQLRDRGLKLDVIIDGGAAGGWFAKIIKEIYPNVKVVMIEPREDMQAELNQIAIQHSGMSVVKQLVGPRVGEVEFFEQLDNSSMLRDHEGKTFGTASRASMTTMDHLMEQMKLKPDLIKLDVQGAELQVLAGADKSLVDAQAVLLEASLFEFQDGTPLFGEVVEFMKSKGFRLYDIFALWHRPLDGALAQGDFFFLKDNHPLLADRRWRTEGQPWVC